MKRIFTLALVLLLMLSTMPFVTANAASATYSFEEFGLKIELPEDLYVLTRDTTQDDPFLVEYDLSLEDAIGWFEDASIYLDAFDENYGYDIFLVIWSDSSTKLFKDFTDLSDEEMEEFMSEYASPSDDSTVLLSYEVFDGQNSRFVKVNTREDVNSDEPYECIEYSSIIGGTMYTMVLSAYDGITDELEEIMKDIADSAVFDTADSDGTDSVQSLPEKFTIEELGLTVVIPAGLSTLTQDIAEDDPLLETLGIDRDTLLEYYIENNIYLNSLPQGITYEVVISCVEDTTIALMKDLRYASEDDMDVFIDGLIEGFESVGSTYISSETYTHPQAKFMKIYSESSVSGVTTQTVQYYTVVDGKGISIVLSSYSGEITDEMEAELREIVDSAEFANAITDEEAEAGLLSSYIPSWMVYVIVAIAAIVIIVVVVVIVNYNKKKKRNAGGSANGNTMRDPWEK